MRSILPLRMLRAGLRPARLMLRPAVIQLLPARNFTSTLPALKKSKAVAAKKQHKEARQAVEDEDEEDPKGGPHHASGELDVDQVLLKTRKKMEKAVDWARGLVYEGVERGRGRISPALLDGVKVTTPDVPGSHSLNSMASVTTKGQTLMVSIWDAEHTKYVESAIHEANLPGISPTRINETTLKIPIARPDNAQRTELLKQIGKTVEEAKNQVRRARTEGLNSLGGRGEEGTDQVQKLADSYGGDLEKTIAQAKKEFEKA